uniref:Uncharacterized protein n=1 Tax=Candidatus Kentrum sp. LFY TaxID=2126342 RepID=A0A450UFV6_9GAMM|nr:MAG: hypothetical protein BECKLFY1418A_GA0070994_10167 [Candidatus Kentron sp. LFY]
MNADKSTEKKGKPLDELAEEFLEIERKKSNTPDPEIEAFRRQIVKQAERFDDLVKELLKIELIVPGIYYLATISKAGNISLNDNAGWAFILWLIAIVLTLFGLFPKRYQVHVRDDSQNLPTVDKPVSRESCLARNFSLQKAKRLKRLYKRITITTIVLFGLLEFLPERHQKWYEALNRIADRPLTPREYFSARAKRTYRYFISSTIAFVLGVIFAGLAMVPGLGIFSWLFR